MEKDLAQFEQSGAQLIALAVQDQTGAQNSVESTGATYPILADPDHRVADTYNVYNLLHDNVAAPSVFIINKSGKIVWSYVGKDANDRPGNQTILDNLPAS